MKKFHFAMINIVQFVLIAILLFVPLLTLYSPVGSEYTKQIIEPRTIFGFHFLTGLTIKNPTSTDALDAYTVLMYSKAVGFIPVLSLLSIFIFDKITKANIGKDFINVLASAVCFIEVFLYPVIAYSLLANQDSIYLDFDMIAPFYIVLVIVGLNFVYFLVRFIVLVKRYFKEEH